MTSTPILMSPSNPNGWKLEDLLDQVRNEVVIKNGRLVADDRPVAKLLKANNQKILKLLSEAQAIQQESIRALDALAPDQGPLGKPRVGVGSDPAPVTEDPLGR